jgi:hypothetical protein
VNGVAVLHLSIQQLLPFCWYNEVESRDWRMNGLRVKSREINQTIFLVPPISFRHSSCGNKAQASGGNLGRFIKF